MSTNFSPAKISTRELNWLIQEKYQDQLTPQLALDLERLEKGEPIDYVIGFIDFLNCKVDLQFRPLIPRPETEDWVERAIDELKNQSRDKLEILDLFAGSGCIRIALLKNLPQAKVDFADKEEKFLRQIKINAQINKIPRHRFRLIKSDLFSNLDRQYDCIFANPPYVAVRLKDSVQKSVLGFEPKAAIFAGDDGLLYLRRFFSKVKDFLKEQGKIYLEFDSWQKGKLIKILQKNNFSTYEFRKDQFGEWRWVVVLNIS